MNLLTRVYATLLHLYPLKFRDEFADEMQSVFADSIAEAARRGNIAVIQVWLKELRDLPRAILREHWQARSKSIMENKPRVSWLELLCAAIPFLLYLALPLIQGLQLGAGSIVILFLLGTLFILLIIGMFKGLPRWSLPAFGFLLAILNYILFGILGILFLLLTATPPLFLREIFGSGFSNIGILVLSLVVMLVTASMKPLRPFFQKMREDWTLLPFALYGIMPVVIYARFDAYRGRVPYEIGMGLVLLVGLWLYLRFTRLELKLSVLGISITLAMAIEAIGKWILIPSQSWVDIVEQTIQGEVTSTIYTWFWVMVVVFFPALLGLLPHSTRSTQATQP